MELQGQEETTVQLVVLLREVVQEVICLELLQDLQTVQDLQVAQEVTEVQDQADQGITLVRIDHQEVQHEVVEVLLHQEVHQLEARLHQEVHLQREAHLLEVDHQEVLQEEEIKNNKNINFEGWAHCFHPFFIPNNHNIFGLSLIHI